MLTLQRLKKMNGQGATEYIIILAVIAALLLIFLPGFKDKIKGKATETLGSLDGVSAGTH